MKLTLLGTGSPVPSLKRSSAGYMLRIGGDLILIDHGPGAFHRMMQAGVKVTDVTHIFFSHLHFDHCADFVPLFLSRWDLGGGLIPPMKIYGPPGIQQFVERLFGPDGAFAPDLTARTHHPQSIRIFESRGGIAPRPWPETSVTELDPNDLVESEGWRLRVVNVPHHQPYLVNFGIRVESGDGVFAYSSDVSTLDTGPAEALYGLAREADVMVHYLNAFSFDVTTSGGKTKQQAVAELARDAGVKTLVTTHHGPAIDRGPC